MCRISFSAPDQTQPSNYVGCMMDGPTRDMTSDWLGDYYSTPDSCQTYCKNNNFPYGSVQVSKSRSLITRMYTEKAKFGTTQTKY